MADRPILFSGPMVRALWDDRKTQTRRMLKFQPAPGISIIRKTIRPIDANPYHSFERRSVYGNYAGELDIKIKRGDRLWVRETWSHTGDHVFSISEARMSPFGHTIYQADENSEYPYAKFWPSIHMPREFSRLTLIVTDVRVERLQDISEADAIAEGCRQYSSSTKLSRPFNADWKGIYREGYAELWNEINGARSWEANPWVAAYTFRVIKQNIDQIEKVAA